MVVNAAVEQRGMGFGFQARPGIEVMPDFLSENSQKWPAVYEMVMKNIIVRNLEDIRETFLTICKATSEAHISILIL